MTIHTEIKTKTYCMHGMHSVMPEDMSSMTDEKGRRIRICSGCKNLRIERQKKAKK